MIFENDLDDTELAERFDDLAGRDLPAAAVTYVLPASALSAWPFPAETVTSGTPPPPMPLPLARQVYLFEALFLPSALRLAVTFPDAEQRLRRIVSSLRRARRLYGCTNAGEPPEGVDVRTLFDEGSSLCEALQDSLLAYAVDRSFSPGAAP